MENKQLYIAAGVVAVLVIALFVGSKTGKIPLPQKSPTPTPVATESAATEKQAITIENYSYSPANLVIKVGETVTWNNKDSVAHTATSDDGVFDTGLIGQNETATVTFDTPGTFSYHCTPHPQMQATIIVE